ncbi:cytochrome P450 2D15-like isoform X2 [Pleurodeles waltl]|uniref:cytochrome P450 2D15-like isoform X2 n=1 Tax=Pleurodeles waltl TaxID=8319 RepID=UPI0037093FC6
MQPPEVPWSLFTAFSDRLTLLGLSITVFVLVFDFMKRRKKWSSYPPGPTSLPFIGNLSHVDFNDPLVSFAKLRKKFGNIFSLQFFWQNMVVVNGFEVMKEVLIHKSEEFADRAHFPMMDLMGYKDNCQGVIAGRYGNAWKEQRRFALTTMRNFGLGKKSLEKRVIEEARYLCSAFESEEGCPFDPHHFINNASSNVICSITFGDRFEYDDKQFYRLLDLLKEHMEAATGFLPQLFNFIPWIRYIPGVRQKVLRPYFGLKSYIKEMAKEHKETWDQAVTRDFVDAFLSEIEKTQDDSKSSFTEDNLILTTIDLFVAGTETTAITLYWCLLYMLLYPDIQGRVQREIDRVIGHSRSPAIEDQANMPYTNAVIHEVQRNGDVAPLAVPHMTYRDTEIQGFFIPKGTTVMTNLSSVLKDETVWEKPHQFYPEHFLDSDGNFVKNEAFLPFSADASESCSLNNMSTLHSPSKGASNPAGQLQNTCTEDP